MLSIFMPGSPVKALSFYLFGLLVLTGLYLFLYTPSTPRSSSMVKPVAIVDTPPHSSDSITPLPSPDKNPRLRAYVTLLCNDAFMEAVLTLRASHDAVKSKYPLLVLVPDKNQVSEPTIHLLEQAGCTVKLIEKLPYPFKETRLLKILNKSCRYSKIQLWMMEEYERIVFLDADTLFIRNIDELFDTDPTIRFAAVPEMAGPDRFNSGVMLLTPSMEIYTAMIQTYKHVRSYNFGDQGFLNEFFTLNHKIRVPVQITWHPLPVRYNTLTGYQDFTIWDELAREMKVLHFTSETKPWNFYHFGHSRWERYLNHHGYYLWRVMHTQGLNMLGVNQTAARDVHKFKENSRLCRTVARSWRNQVKYGNQFSVVISTFNRSMDVLQTLVRHYSSAPSVKEVYIVWNNPQTVNDVPQRWFSYKPVRILRQTTNSLNNRFNPIPTLQTECVFIVDDDMLISIKDLEDGFSIWQSHRKRLVGWFPRSHSVQRVGPQLMWKYHIANHAGYSMMLTKAMFMHWEYLFLYRCLLPEVVHKIVDHYMNCEDIAMNFMVSGISRNKPLAIFDPQMRIEDYGTKRGISTGSDHLNKRDQCMRDFGNIFGQVLQYSHDTAAPFRKNPPFEAPAEGEFKKSTLLNKI